MSTNAILFNTVRVWCPLSPGIRWCFQLFQPFLFWGSFHQNVVLESPQNPDEGCTYFEQFCVKGVPFKMGKWSLVTCDFFFFLTSPYLIPNRMKGGLHIVVVLVVAGFHPREGSVGNIEYYSLPPAPSPSPSPRSSSNSCLLK